MANILKTTLRTTLYIILSLSLFHVSDETFSEDISEAIMMKQMEKTTHLHFFFHDYHHGESASAVQVVYSKDSTNFGNTYVVDNSLREGQDVSSREVGKAQGIYSYVAKNNGDVLLMMFTYQFTVGEFNGSGFNVVGRNPLKEDPREIPIVGGTGRFLYARGYALARTVWSLVDDAIVEYDVYVKHY